MAATPKQIAEACKTVVEETTAYEKLAKQLQDLQGKRGTMDAEIAAVQADTQAQRARAIAAQNQLRSLMDQE